MCVDGGVSLQADLFEPEPGKVFENNRASLVGKAEGRLGCWILQRVNLSVNGNLLGGGGVSDEKSPSGG